MDLNNCRDDTLNINLMKCKGKKFSWIVANKPDIIVWGQRKIPECSTDLFRLVQYEDYCRTRRMTTQRALRAFEEKWNLLREKHYSYLIITQGGRYGSRTTQTNANLCGKKSEYAFTD